MFTCKYTIMINYVYTCISQLKIPWEEMKTDCYLRAGVDSVEQLDRRFVSEAFRQADFDCSGGIDCMEPLGLQP